MKRIKLLLAIFTFAAMSTVGYSTYEMTISSSEKLLLANAEALACIENPFNGKSCCVNSSYLWCGCILIPASSCVGTTDVDVYYGTDY